MSEYEVIIQFWQAGPEYWMSVNKVGESDRAVQITRIAWEAIQAICRRLWQLSAADVGGEFLNCYGLPAKGGTALWG